MRLVLLPGLESVMDFIRSIVSSYRKALTLVCGISLVAICLGIAIRYRDSSVVADVIVDETGVDCIGCVWEFGSLDVTKTPYVEHAFRIHNATDVEVSVGEITPECGCMTANNSPEILRPGTTHSISVRFTPSAAPGPFEKRVLVKLDTPISRAIPLTVTGSLAPSPVLLAYPGIVDFGEVLPGDSVYRTARLARYDGSDVALRSVEFRESKCASACSISKETETDLIGISIVNDGSIEGDVKGSILIRTAHAIFPSIEIPLKAKLVGLSDAFVDSITITDMKRDDQRQMLLFRSNALTNAGLSIEGLEFVGDESIDVKLLDEGPLNTSQSVSISLKPNAPVMKLSRGILAVQVAGHTGKAVSIPVVVHAAY
jgi:hypothetical protein